MQKTLNSWMNLINYKKVAVIAAAIGIAACLLPESAQGGIGKASGSSTNTSRLSFDINTSLADQNPSNCVGYFPGAIKNFNIEGGFTNSFICGNSVCPPGNVKVTKLRKESTSGNVLDLYIGSEKKQVKLAGLQSLLSIKSPPNFNVETNDIVRYDITFGNTYEPALVFFVQSKDSKLINDLSGLDQLKDRIPGLFPSRDVIVSDDGNTAVLNGGVFSFSLQATSQQKSAATAIVTLLALGSLSTLSLLRRSEVGRFFKNKIGVR
ncbi:hypothetical protein SD80_031725 [Scytonema tolypothrichoides VB-61278]|nr:hypothetical protein SD80_031725 [Scytonema tolypothrichoides VB-61278]